MKSRTSPNDAGNRTGGSGSKYRNECSFLRTAGDEGNPVNHPDLVEQEPNPTQSVHSHVWGRFAHEEPGLSSRERRPAPDGTNLGMRPLMFSQDAPNTFMDQPAGDNSSVSMTTNPDGLSNRPTPNSGSTSDHRHSASGEAGNGGSYDTSPNTANESSLADMEAAATQFLQQAMNNGYHVPGSVTGVSSEQRFSASDTSGTVDFTISSEWDPTGGQTGVTPVAEGVLRNLIDNIGPIGSMDLDWDSGA